MATSWWGRPWAQKWVARAAGRWGRERWRSRPSRGSSCRRRGRPGPSCCRRGCACWSSTKIKWVLGCWGAVALWELPSVCGTPVVGATPLPAAVGMPRPDTEHILQSFRALKMYVCTVWLISAFLAHPQAQVLEAPEGAAVLASSERCPVEMFAVGPHVLCIQAGACQSASGSKAGAGQRRCSTAATAAGMCLAAHAQTVQPVRCCN